MCDEFLHSKLNDHSLPQDGLKAPKTSSFCSDTIHECRSRWMLWIIYEGALTCGTLGRKKLLVY